MHQGVVEVRVLQVCGVEDAAQVPRHGRLGAQVLVVGPVIPACAATLEIQKQLVTGSASHLEVVGAAGVETGSAIAGPWDDVCDIPRRHLPQRAILVGFHAALRVRLRLPGERDPTDVAAQDRRRVPESPVAEVVPRRVRLRASILGQAAVRNEARALQQTELVVTGRGGMAAFLAAAAATMGLTDRGAGDRRQERKQRG
mmetsp:Transcript_41155/g.119164  ORF Transcript_41155/g.119164 Transcript_41155/m.119164 type:complete len:200 (+) Transcript_41155:955-1554(+)